MAKQFLISFVVLGFSSAGYSQVPEPDTTQPVVITYNPQSSKLYQRVLSPLKPTTDSSVVVLSAVPEDVVISTDYFDVTGRPLEKIIKQASPNKKDLVAFTAYDKYGRQTRQYLPYVQQSGNTDDGKFKCK